ncbi:DJ-1 family glyoxalase III [Anaerosporobacter faecicola]|uniref:DJ-1 family glyoxalase III n=1 Tax=Anaerosporobacter faecicola TaxID=2718714 RepID=UPI00143BF9A4|nr:DJ-1 family glyoxalase III [Anaerosporobacter faecicola]
MKKVAVFFADGFEEIEALTTVDILRRAKIDVTLVSMKGIKEVYGAHKIAVVTERFFDDVNYEAIDMLVLPGGMPGTTRLAESKPLQKLIQKFYDNGKYVSAICAAPSILGNMGLLNGKKATCYPGYEDKLKGATIVDEEAVVDGTIVTGRSMSSSVAFSLALVEQLEGKELADSIAKSVVYQSKQ